jgi:hypothetical protein
MIVEFTGILKEVADPRFPEIKYPESGCAQPSPL